MKTDPHNPALYAMLKEVKVNFNGTVYFCGEMVGLSICKSLNDPRNFSPITKKILGSFPVAPLALCLLMKNGGYIL